MTRQNGTTQGTPRTPHTPRRSPRNTPGDPAQTAAERNRAARTASRMPPTWTAQHLAQQTLVLLIAGIAALLVAWDSPIIRTALAPLDAYALVIPGGQAVALGRLAPLAVPLVLGVPLALGRHRALLLLWITLTSVIALAGILEVARLNWIAFIGGVAFRIESGPVPLVRSTAGLALVLCGVLLMAHQSVHHHVHLLAERGVPRDELALARTSMLQNERRVITAAFAGGTLLMLVVAISMQLSERAPGETSLFIPAVVWSALLLAFVVLIVTRKARQSRDDEASGHPHTDERET